MLLLSVRYPDKLNLLSWPVLYTLVTIQVFVSAMAFLSLLRTITKATHRKNTNHFADSELPTVSVAIPARNETTDLEACLHSLIANDYPKLEILVYDDCSQDKTAEIIKSFAHDGVRFISGSEPQDRWLAKNQAYEKLRDEATGEILMFCGVDTRFGPRAIRALVTTMLNRKKSMISVLPLRHYATPDGTLIQPMRYWWELVPPRRFFNRPPALSTCWLITRQALNSLGGFKAVSRAIIPETYFARELAVRDDAYSFIRADEELDVQTVKSFEEQRNTAIRTRYPQLKRRPENIMLLFAAELLFLIGPFVLAIASILFGNIILATGAIISSFLLTLTHTLIIHITCPANVPLAFINFPAVVISELGLLILSMYRYEFGKVIWKERNVCIPVMHVTPRLPKI